MSARGLSGGKSGAVTAVQRVSSDLRLNPHFHSIALDGVYVEEEHGELIFHPLPCLTNGDVADILQIASTRILTLLRHKGVIEDHRVNADESLADCEPALAELAVASVLGRVPAGPALRQQDPIRLSKGRELEYPKGFCASAHGLQGSLRPPANGELVSFHRPSHTLNPTTPTLSARPAPPRTSPPPTARGIARGVSF